MSKSKDRARAESGLIFRDGELVNKEEWYAAHPTREMLAERQAGVDKAVSNIILANDKGEPYFCTKCNAVHRRGKVFVDHRQFASKVVVL